MARTTRTVPHDTLRWGKLNPGYYDIRDALFHGRDHGPHSPLYYHHIKQSGWSRDYNNSPSGRQVCKKCARRYRRRQDRPIINDFLSGEDYGCEPPVDGGELDEA